MLGRVLIAIAVISVVALTSILNSTTPATAGAFGILMVFVLAYMFTLSCMTFLLYGISRGVAFVGTLMNVKRPLATLSLQKSYYFGTILALAPVIIVSMQSIGGVGIRELGLILLFVLIGCLYVTKRSAN